VGKDFGAMVAYYIDLCYPDRVKGVVTLGIPYSKPGGLSRNMDSAPKGLYIKHWQVFFLPLSVPKKYIKQGHSIGILFIL